MVALKPAGFFVWAESGHFRFGDFFGMFGFGFWILESLWAPHLSCGAFLCFVWTPTPFFLYGRSGWSWMGWRSFCFLLGCGGVVSNI